MKKHHFDEPTDEIPEIPRGAQFRKSRHQVSPNAPMPKRNLRLGLEANVLAWFQAEERHGGLSCEEHINQALRQHIINLIGDKRPSLAQSKKKKDSIKPASNAKRTIKQRRPSRKALLAFAEKTLGMWADDPNLERAFAEFEMRWQEWREETLK